MSSRALLIPVPTFQFGYRQAAFLGLRFLRPPHFQIFAFLALFPRVPRPILFFKDQALFAH